jgi:hypothetical protein
MSEDRARILNMLKEGKISVQEADELIEALGKNENKIPDSPVVNEVPKKTLKFLRVIVESKESKKEKVNVKIPLNLIRAGIKLQSFLPNSAKDKLDLKFGEKGMQFKLDDINPENIEAFIDAFGDMSVDIDDEGEKVRIFCE